MITRDEIEEFLILFKIFDPHDESGMDMLRIIHEHTREELDRFIELYDKFDAAAEHYFSAYILANHYICGLDSFTSSSRYDSIMWTEHDRFHFTGVRRYKPGDFDKYEADKKFPEGYFSGQIYRYGDENITFNYSLNELLIENPEDYFNKKYTELMEQNRLNEEAARIADQKRLADQKYKQYLELKNYFEPTTSQPDN